MRRYDLGLIGFCCMGSLLTVAPQASAEPQITDHQDSCFEWEFSTDLGFEGGQAGAILACPSTEGNWEEIPLQLLCSQLSPDQQISIRYVDIQGSEEELPPSRSTQLAYRFGDDEFSETAIYEAAFGDWVIYKPIDDPLIQALATSSFVEILYADRVERLPLTGSSMAIAELQDACGGQ